MKLNKTKNTVRNVFFGSILKIYQIVLPFIFRSVIIYTLGVEYLGLNSLFSSILQMLNLAELGVGSAMVFSMYQPIVEDDTYRICALIKLYQLYYRAIGAVILLVGVVCTPFIPKLISGDVPNDVNIYVLYLLNLVATVLTYWLFSYKTSVFNAYQRIDITSKISLITDTIKYLFQFGALIFFNNYYLFVIGMLISQIIYNCVVAIAARKMYPQYIPKGILPKKERSAINKRIGDLFTTKIGGTIVSSADTIVISAFLGLEILAIYQNYFYILNAVSMFILIINNSVVAGIGNSMLIESLDKNYLDFEIFNFLQFWIMGVCVCCFSALFQPFMEIWMGKDLMFPFLMVVLFCFYFWGYGIEKMLSVFKDAGGIWHEDRFRPFIYGMANLILNIILVQYINIYGVVLSTIGTVFVISLPWIIHNIFTLIYKRSPKPYIKQIIIYTFVTMFAAVINYTICEIMPGGLIISFALKCVVSIIVPNLVFCFFYKNNSLFALSIELIKKIIRKKT